jgi:hypothetical protein
MVADILLGLELTGHEGPCGLVERTLGPGHYIDAHGLEKGDGAGPHTSRDDVGDAPFLQQGRKGSGGMSRVGHHLYLPGLALLHLIQGELVTVAEMGAYLTTLSGYA